MKIRIYYEDTDCGGIVYHTNYLKYCERARSEQVFNKLGKNIFNANFGFVVKEVNAKFLSPARLGDELEIFSKCQKIGAASISLRQEIFLEKKLIFSADIVLVYLANAKPTRIPQNFIEIFKNFN